MKLSDERRQEESGFFCPTAGIAHCRRGYLSTYPESELVLLPAIGPTPQALSAARTSCGISGDLGRYYMVTAGVGRKTKKGIFLRDALRMKTTLGQPRHPHGRSLPTPC